MGFEWILGPLGELTSFGRLDDERFFCHPSEAGEFTQWTKDPLKAHKWVDFDSCSAAARTSDMVWQIPAKVHSIVL